MLQRELQGLLGVGRFAVSTDRKAPVAEPLPQIHGLTDPTEFRLDVRRIRPDPDLQFRIKNQRGDAADPAFGLEIPGDALFDVSCS